MCTHIRHVRRINRAGYRNPIESELTLKLPPLHKSDFPRAPVMAVSEPLADLWMSERIDGEVEGRGGGCLGQWFSKWRAEDDEVFWNFKNDVVLCSSFVLFFVLWKSDFFICLCELFIVVFVCSLYDFC